MDGPIAYDAQAICDEAADAYRARRKRLAAADGTELLDAWLRRMVAAVPYDRPEPERGGWDTVGEVRDRSWNRHALVQVAPDTGERRTVWRDGRSPRWTAGR